MKQHVEAHVQSSLALQDCFFFMFGSVTKRKKWSSNTRLCPVMKSHSSFIVPSIGDVLNAYNVDVLLVCHSLVEIR